MGMNIIEKILADHSQAGKAEPGDILDVEIDTRVARDFGGANVVKNIREHGLGIADPGKTFFTFDCNPTGSDQKYTANQQICRVFAREHGIRVYDINRGIGTHILIEEGLVYPGATAVSTDSHANLLGAVGAFGQGMGDKDMAAVWSNGSIWFRVPESVRLVINGMFPDGVSAKDIVLCLLSRFGTHTFLGKCLELQGEAVDGLSLDKRITIASMGTEMGALTILMPPNRDVITYCESRVSRKIDPVYAAPDARYAVKIEMAAEEFTRMVSRPGKPHDAVPLDKVRGTRVDSVFIGSCTNGRMEDMRAAAAVLEGKKVADGVVLKIVPSTDRIWNMCLEEGLMEKFKDAGALVSNPGCAGCAAGQVGQNGPGEVSVSSGNRNFPGKQGQGEIYLASPEIAAASAISGVITSPDQLFEAPVKRAPVREIRKTGPAKAIRRERPVEFTGRAWYIPRDDIDTDMIFHNRHLAITDIGEMGQHAFGNLEGFEKFALEASKGDIVFAGKNFGAGSSRQQAVDCFKSLGVACIVAESFGSIYERNAINAAFPILTSADIRDLEIRTGDLVSANIKSGKIVNLNNRKSIQANPFSGIQMEIYQNGGLF